MTEIRIRNERLWEIAQKGEDLDYWLEQNIGLGNWKEMFGLTNLPYRQFLFKHEKDAVLFALRWS